MGNFNDIKNELQDSIEDYQLKTDDELIDMLCEFGLGELEFHTADIERLIREKQYLENKIKGVNSINNSCTLLCTFIITYSDFYPFLRYLLV